MFETLRIKLFGRQPFAKVSNKTLERLIHREFGDRANEVKQKLGSVTNYTPESKNRILAAIVKLADKDVNAVDKFIEMSNTDDRDVLAKAEYPECLELGFGKTHGNKMKQIYLTEWEEYSNCLKKT